MMSVSARVAIFGLLCSAATPTAAQSRPPVVVDQRVRVWTDAAEAIVGRVAAIDAGSLQIERPGSDRITVPLTTIRRVEASRTVSKSAGAKKGAIRGAIIAGAIGAIALGLQHDEVGDEGSSAGKAAALGAWSGGLFGGLFGAGIGAARAGEKWDVVWP